MHNHSQDPNLGARTRIAHLVMAAALSAPLAVAGCGGSGSEACAAGSGDGMLMVNITGHDPGAVTVEGLSTVVETSSTVSLPAGPHMVTAARVTTPQTGITSQAFEGTVDKPEACVKAGATTIVNVTYAPIPTSGKLWFGVSNAGSVTMLGYLPASVAATGTAGADVLTNTGGSDGFTFDNAGNMWVLGGTTADHVLARYPAAMFAGGGVDKTPDIFIDNSPSFGSAIPGPKVVAFDPTGNLWVSVVASDKVIKFTAAQIAATGNPTATVERSGLTSPQGLAFDSAGNLWVAAHDDAAVVRIDAAHLATSGSGGDLSITAEYTASGVTSMLRFPIGLAFDAAGNLWVNYDGPIAKIPVAELTGTGTKMIVPPVVITTDVSTLPVGIAFDQSGGLWLAGAVNSFARFDATQLAASGSVAPSTIITSIDVGSAGWFAMYPAPASLPLYHKVP